MNSLAQLIDFVSGLQTSKIHFRLECVRDAIMVVVPTPDEYWEIEFFADGHIEVQAFGPQTAVRTVTFDQINQIMVDKFPRSV